MSQLSSRLHTSLEHLALPDGPLAYQLRRSARRRTLALRVTEQADVVVNAPLRLGRGEIETFIHRHLDWLHQRRQEAAQRRVTWADGAPLPFLGETLTLHILPRPGRPALRLQDGTLTCACLPEAAEAAVLAWYRREARALLGERLAVQAGRAGRAVPVMRLSNARTRWGSLSPAGVVSLNWRLIKAPLAVIDYVICHELAHFRQRNHSPAFWREVALLCPDWQVLRRRLKEAGRGYFLF
jgi:predicted metal-dependent hydrolase